MPASHDPVSSMDTEAGASSAWHRSACILCSINCGIEVTLDGRRLHRIRGDRQNPRSQGYTCEKALKLDHYQNGRDRLRAPLRRRPDGTFEEIDWDTAIAEVAARLGEVRAHHGGASIFYYGGGGQGNHLGGAYASATRRALGAVYTSNALAQEKTGEFWVDGQLYGRPRCHTTGDFEHAEVLVFVGKNPWHSHGFPRARAVLRAVSADPERALVVIDPCRTETAELADHHLRVRPGTDAFCLAALGAILIQENLVAGDFIDTHTTGFEELAAVLRAVSVADYAARAGVDPAELQAVARRIARAQSVSILEDLGIQQAPHSTLNSYLEKLLYLLTGNFARRGAMNIHTRMAGLGGGPSGRTSPVGGHRIITGLVPCNVIADEILSDHPQRFRAMIVESANPAHSLADSARMRQALGALDCLVVLDVAMTETARLAHYILPSPSQYEKWEATFFTVDFPENYFQLRAPLLAPLPGTLPEPEIHWRLVRALGALTDEDTAELHAAAKADPGRGTYAMTFMRLMAEKPKIADLAPLVLYETLGPTLGAGRQAAAVLWGAAHSCALTYPDAVRRAGFAGEGPALGEALFEALLARREGVVFTVDEYEDTWRRLATADGRIRLAVPELLTELAGLQQETAGPGADPAFPFILAAGERRTSTANTIFRDPAWRKKDAAGALTMHPDDAARLGVVDGGPVRITTRRGSAQAVVALSDRVQPGHITLPNGRGLIAAGANAAMADGVPPNELTCVEERDPIAGTPWHKHVRARVEALG